MSVPSGDQRDFEFAKKFDLEIIEVISKDGKNTPNLEEAYPGHGLMLNSGEYNGMTSEEFTQAIIKRIEKEGLGKAAINYKLRDWVFTRQRYWGEPIPVLHGEKGSLIAVNESDLPVLLPKVASYQGTEEGESPLAKVEDWVVTTDPRDGSLANTVNTTLIIVATPFVLPQRMHLRDRRNGFACECRPRSRRSRPGHRR